VQVDRREIQLQQAHVLDDQRIDPGVVILVYQAARGFQFGIVQDGIESDENARPVAVRELDQRGDLADGVDRVVARAERRPADVDCVRAMQDGFAADGGGFGWGEEFKCFNPSRFPPSPS
jgi:hypothetical protein